MRRQRQFEGQVCHRHLGQHFTPRKGNPQLPCLRLQGGFQTRSCGCLASEQKFQHDKCWLLRVTSRWQSCVWMEEIMIRRCFSQKPACDDVLQPWFMVVPQPGPLFRAGTRFPLPVASAMKTCVSVALRPAVKSSGGPCCDLGAVAVPGCACKRVCVTRACGFFEAESAKAEALFELLPVMCMRSHHRCFGFQPRGETSSGSALVFVRHSTGMCSVSGIA